MNADQLAALIGIYELRVREDIDDKVYGLRELHAQELWARLRILQLKCSLQRSITVGLRLIEAKAFLDYWELDDRPLNAYTANVVRMVLERANKAVSDMRPYMHC